MARVYGFDEYTAREVVRTVRDLQRQVRTLDKKSKTRPSGKPLLMFAKTTLEPGGTCQAYLAKRENGVISPNINRGTYTINDYLFSSFAIGIDDYDSSGNGYQEAVVQVFGDIKTRAFTPTGEHNLILNATPDSTIASGGSGSFSVYSGSTDTSVNIDDVNVSWGDSGEGVTSGKESWIKFNRYTKGWEWIGGDCES